MKKTRRKQKFSFGSLVPRGRSERRRLELLGIEAFVAFAVLIVLAFFVSGLQPLALRSPQAAAVVSAMLVDLANGDRAAQGFGTLKINPTLVAAAQAKANDMAGNGYFAHTSPDGVDAWHWFAEAGYRFEYAGENLAVDFSDSGDVERAWMNSTTHRENILNPHFTEIGIATAEGIYQGRPTTFVVQEFGLPAAPSEAQAGTPVPNSREAQTVAAATSPTSPTESAIATRTQVLGSAAKEPPAPHPAAHITVASKENNQSASGAIVTTSPTLAAILASDPSPSAQLWTYPLGYPRATLRYVYYAIGLLILLALALDTGLEIRWHHRKRAARAGLLLAGMCILFALAHYMFFSQPVIVALAQQQPADVGRAL